MDNQKHLPTSLKLNKILFLVVLLASITYLVLRFGFSNLNQTILLTVIGFGIALWMILKPTEWAIEGLELLAKRVGIGDYAAGVLGSLMATLPELVLSILLVINGKGELALLIILITAGANTLLFGFIILKSIRSTGGKIKVPVSTLRYETELLIVTFIVAFFLFAFNFADKLIALSNHPTVLISDTIQIPIFFSVGIVLIYSFYLYFLIKDKEINPPRTKEEKKRLLAEPALAWKNISKFLILGILGVIIAGELLATGAEDIVHVSETFGFSISTIYIAFIVGLLGSLPEWAIAFKVGENIELLFGNVLSSISTALLLMVGLISIFITISGGEATLNSFGIVQFVLAGLILLVTGMLMKDDKFLDSFEGVCIVILQLIGFVILLTLGVST